jgi:hypothetical protein
LLVSHSRKTNGNTNEIRRGHNLRKVKIEERDLNKNKTEQNDEERALFHAFLEDCPGFASEKIRDGGWSLVDDQHQPPDVTIGSDRSVGVEITQWTPEVLMRAAGSRNKIERKLLEAITPQPVNKWEYFEWVFFYPRAKVPDITLKFRASLFQSIEYVDHSWPSNRHGMAPYRFGDLQGFPPLDKYFEQVLFFPPNPDLNAAVAKAMKSVPGTILQSEPITTTDWIVPGTTFEQHGASADSLLKLFQNKAKRWSKLKPRYAQLHLVVAYDHAIPHSSTIWHAQKIAKEAAAKVHVQSLPPFDHVFLLIAVEGNPG